MASYQAMMYLSAFEALRQRYHQLSTGKKRGVYFVSDRAKWAFDQITFALIKELNKTTNLRAHRVRNPWSLRGQVIHFINRYAFLNGPNHELHASNQIIVNWYHGGEAGTGPEFDPLLDSLMAAQELIDKVVAPCTLIREALVERGLPEERVAILPIGVDLVRFGRHNKSDRVRQRERLGIPQDAVCIGSFQKDGVGWHEGLEPKLVKGPDVFLDVIWRIAKVVPKLHVLLTGPSRGYVKQGLEAQDVSYTHRLVRTFDHMVDYYNALDLYLITSRSEGGPMSLLESWASGVPVVSTNVGMAADLIENGSNGNLAPVGDSTQLAEMALTLLEDEGYRARVRRQASIDVLQYDWPVIARRHVDELYRPTSGE